MNNERGGPSAGRKRQSHCPEPPAYRLYITVFDIIMSVATMLHQPSRISRASTSSSSSFVPISRQNTMSSHDGGRSMRQSKRMSVTALYLSMSAKDKEFEIEDELARGESTAWRYGR